MRNPCAAAAAATTFVGAALPHPERAYLYDHAADRWTRLPDLPDGGRLDAACGFDSASGDLVVAGGRAAAPDFHTLSSAVVFSSGRWRYGEGLPEETAGAAAVAAGGSFLVVGGEGDAGPPRGAAYRYASAQK